MRTTTSLAVIVLLLAGTASAASFTGRYLVESEPDRGASVSGWIDFLNAPAGATSFRLGDSFVTDYALSVAGGGVDPLVFGSPTPLQVDDLMPFADGLGSAVMRPILTPVVGSKWEAAGDLDGQADGVDTVTLYSAVFQKSQPTWVASWDDGSSYRNMKGFFPPAWRLRLEPIPEPGSLALIALGLGILVWRRRRPTSS